MAKIEHISRKIGVLERRIEHLNDRLNKGQARSPGYDKVEVEALEAATVCMKLHRADAEGIDGPIGALRAVLDSLGTASERDAVRRARLVLQDWE